MSTEVSSCRICFVSFAGSVIMNWTELIFSGTSLLGLLWHLGWKQPNPLERFWVCFCQALRNIPYNFGVLKQHRHYIWTLDFHGERLSYQKRWLTSYPYPWPRQRLFLINAIVFSLRSKHSRDPIWFFMWQSQVHFSALHGPKASTSILLWLLKDKVLGK